MTTNTDASDWLAAQIVAHQSTVEALKNLSPQILEVANLCSNALRAGGKIILGGNGGSAADAQHFAAELVGRFEQERRGLAAIALSCNAATLTSIGNDYGFEHIFSRQIEAIAQPSDIFVAISTSGNSANIVAAAVAAGALGCPVIALTGSKASKLSVLAQHWLPMPSDHTARIQEAYLLVGHILCGLMEKDFVRH